MLSGSLLTETVMKASKLCPVARRSHSAGALVFRGKPALICEETEAEVEPQGQNRTTN